MLVRRTTCLWSLAAALLAPHAARAQTAEPVTLRVGAALDDQSKPIFYAQQAGLFAKAGLDVQLVTLNGGGAAIAAAVAGGSLDLGKSNALETTTARSSSRRRRRSVAPAILPARPWGSSRWSRSSRSR